MPKSHVEPETFGDELDRSIYRLKESFCKNVFRALQQVFLPKQSSSDRIKTSDDTSEAIQSSHAFDSSNMNGNLDLHVSEEPTVVECEELVAMFVEEGREPFVLPYEFCAKTIVDEDEISDAAEDKIAERMKGSARIRIGEEINHNYFKDSTTKSIVDCSLCAEIIEDNHNLATVENEYISNVSLGDDTEKVSNGAALNDLVVAEIKDGDTNSEDHNKLKIDLDTFPSNVINFDNKRVLIRSSQAESERMFLLMIVLLQG
jgi:hypothetical protein